jgi:hypothetical protein
MATIHATLTGAELHEPKGVAGANDGQVATASSGVVTWAAPVVPESGNLPSEVIVTTLADLGTDEGTFYQLAENTVYKIYGTHAAPFVIDKPMKWAEDTSLESVDVNTGVISITHTSAAIQATGVGVKVKRLDFHGPSNTTGTFLTIDNSITFKSIELTDVLASVWGSLGTVSVGTGFMSINGWNFTDYTAGITLLGAGNGQLNIRNGGCFGEVGTATCINLGISTFNTIAISNNTNAVANGSFVSGLTLGDNIIAGGLGIYSQNNTTVLGSGSVLVGITPEDVGWSMSLNKIELDSATYGQIDFDTAGAADTITLVTGAEVKMLFTTTLTHGERVVQTVNSQLDYVDERSAKIKITAIFTGQTSSGTIPISLSLRKNGSIIYTQHNISVNSSTDVATTLVDFDTADNGDYFDVTMNRVSGTANYECSHFQLLLEKV